MKLLREQCEDFDTELIVEETSGKKNYFIEGVFLQSEIKNRNGRIYPKTVMMNEVNRHIKEHLDANRSVGELGHPTNPSINLDRVSHKIISLRENGNDYIGKAKVLDTPYGKIVKNLIDEGVKFGVSSRALGSLKSQNGSNIVCEDFHLITPADVVSDPSAPDAFVTGLMENREWAWDNGKLIEQEAEIKSFINTSHKSTKINEASLLAIFEYILQKI